jgi:hypothetical protein
MARKAKPKAKPIKPPTPKQIEAEIARLTDLNHKVPSTTAFGDSNFLAIEAQIEVLVNDFREEDVYAKQQDDDWNEYVAHSAIEAVQWLDGDTATPPSKDWEPLAK